jgi:multiple antibiotic resistance protein
MRISEPALGIAGGIILFIIAIRMIFPHEQENAKTKLKTEPFIVPLAIPLIAGPSTLTMVMLFANQQPNEIWLWLVAVSIAWFVSALILIFSYKLRRVLGEPGLVAIERLMGMILTTMAVQMFLTGIREFFHLT